MMRSSTLLGLLAALWGACEDDTGSSLGGNTFEVCSPAAPPEGNSLELITVALSRNCFADPVALDAMTAPLIATTRTDLPVVLDENGCQGLNARLDSTFDFATNRVALVRYGANLSVRALTNTGSALVIETFQPLSGALAEATAIAVRIPLEPASAELRHCVETCGPNCEPPP